MPPFLSPETAITFFAAAVLLALAPGPDNIFVLAQSALHGRRAGVLVTLGLCSGLVVHTLAVALGVAAVFQASALAFTALKVLGAAYLAYLAYGALRACAQGAREDLSLTPEQPRSGLRLYGRGVVMNVTNPKVAIFFLAFLPQFVTPEAGLIPWQIAQLGALFMLAAFLIFGLFALAAGTLGKRLFGSAMGQRIMNGLAGCIFAGLAVRLLIQER